MKILHIAPTPFFSNRGCHIRIRNEIEGLLQRGESVILCTYGLGGEVEHLDTRRIPSIPGYTQTKAGFSPYKFLADFLLFFLVLYTTWREKPGIIHGHLHEGAFIGWGVKIALFWRRIPLVMDMQGSLSGELSAYGTFKSFPFLLRFFYFLEKLICSFPQIILCSSEKSVCFLLDVCKVDRKKIYLLEDVVPDSFLEILDQQKLKKQYDIPADKKVIIYTGSFLSGKGIDILLGATTLLLSRNTDLLFVYIGYPEEVVEKYIREQKHEQDCRVIGEIPYDTLASWLAVADLAIDPKEEESGEASGKILHYMACGLPVVCFNTKNNHLYLAEDAFFAECGSTDDLSRKIEEGVREYDKAKEYGSIGRGIVKKNYSLRSASEKLINHYQRLLK